MGGGGTIPSRKTLLAPNPTPTPTPASPVCNWSRLPGPREPSSAGRCILAELMVSIKDFRAFTTSETLLPRLSRHFNTYIWGPIKLLSLFVFLSPFNLLPFFFLAYLSSIPLYFRLISPFFVFIYLFISSSFTSLLSSLLVFLCVS